MSLNNVEVHKDKVTGEIPIGSGVHYETDSMIDLANRYKLPVHTKLNSWEVVAYPGDTHDAVMRRYEEAKETSRKEYLESEQYQKDQQAQEDRENKTRAECQDLLDNLYIAVYGMDTTVDWVGRFAHIGSTKYFDPKYVASRLARAEWYQKSYEEGTQGHEAKHIVKQAIDTLADGMPILPVANHFANEYKKKWVDTLYH